MDNLTPQLNDDQLKQNIDHMMSSNVPQSDVQSYVNNYEKSSDGTYKLKGQNTGNSDSLWGEEKQNWSQAMQDRGDFKSGKTKLPRALLRETGDVANGLINTPVKHLVLNPIVNGYNWLAKKTPVIGTNSAGHPTHVLPTNDDFSDSVHTLGIDKAASDFQQNHPDASRDLVAGKDVAQGVLTVMGAKNMYDTYQAAHSPTAAFQRQLVDTGVSNDVDAPKIAKTLSDNGLTDITNPRDVAITTNKIDQAAQYLKQVVEHQVPDSISGELSDTDTAMQGHLNDLLTAKDALQKAVSVPTQQPGLISNLMHGTATGATKLAKYGLTYYLLRKALQGSPLLDQTVTNTVGGTLKNMASQ